jgi:alpha-glucosidase
MLPRGWWQGGVIYQVYLPAFFDGNNDGMGDLIGLEHRLDYIEKLGVDAIWISPFYRSPMRDAGYDVSDYQSVDPAFGTLHDFDRIVAKAHAVGLRIIIDQVWSHTSSDHPWFQESRSSQSNGKFDWYVWADSRPDGSPPNNWLSVFGGSAWQWDPSRRQYYLHHFLTTQPKLNLRNPHVLAEHFATAEFWLARGVDGFRLDAIDFMLHDEALRDNPEHPDLAGTSPWNPFRKQNHLYDMCNPDAGTLMQRIRHFMDRFPHAMTIGEISSEAGALNRIATLTAEGRLHMAYTLGVMKSAFSPTMLRQALRDARELNQAGWLCWSFSNHDVARVATRWNPTGQAATAFTRMLMAFLLCLPGSVCLYQGEELGLPDAQVPRSSIRDPFGLTFYPVFAGRDGSRTPLPWIAGARNSGFSPADPTWLPIGPEQDRLAVDRLEADPDSLLQATRRLLAWRRSHQALAIGSIEILDVTDPVVAFTRQHHGDAVFAAYNLTPEVITLPTSALPRFRPDDPTGFATAPKGETITFAPFGFVLGTMSA